jgi:hypothetical protein
MERIWLFCQLRVHFDRSGFGDRLPCAEASLLLPFKAIEFRFNEAECGARIPIFP